MSYYKSKKGYYYKQTGGGSVRVSETTYRSKSMKGGDNVCNSDRNISYKIPGAADDVKNAIKEICIEINKINKLLNPSVQTFNSNQTKKRWSLFKKTTKTSLNISQTDQYKETLRILNIAYNILFQQQELLQKERKDTLNKQATNKLVHAQVQDKLQQQQQQQQQQQLLQQQRQRQPRW
jgi:hypothetical protein